jgi:prophage antirepressor-like protein
MNELQIFNNPEFGEIRTINENGVVLFCGSDVARALGYSRPNEAVATHAKGTVKRRTLTNGGEQEMAFIPESDLYRLIFRSKLPSAERFTDWVTAEVLPSIRKNGGYIAQQDTLSPEELMAKALMVAQQTIADREARLQAQAAEISALTVDKQIMQPKAEYFDDLVDRNLLTNFTEAAKQIGVKRKALIGFMVDHGYLYRDKKGNLLPYANKKSDGLFDVKQSTNQKTGWAGCQTLLTPKGVETFRLLCQGL